MAENWSSVRFRCTGCDGTGTYPGVGGNPCVCCEGTGYTQARLEIDTSDIVTKLNQIKKKVEDIWAKVNV